MLQSKGAYASGANVRLFQALSLVGACCLAAGLFVTPQRTWANILLVSCYLLGLGLGGLVWVALHHVTGARWSTSLIRIPQAMGAALPWAAAGVVAVLLFRPSLYSWSAPAFAEEAASGLKHLWLSRPFFLVRALLYVAVWLAFAAKMTRNDRVSNSKNVALSGAFLVVFGITCWLASYDWIMSLEPEWASTIFGVYNFAGLFVSSLAAATLLVIWLRRYPPLHAAVTDDQLHDLGTLLFAFSSFWMYIWFCQYMLIWFVNNPEETVYYLRRTSGAGPALAFANVALMWGIPFLVLLFRRAKRNEKILGTVASLVLVGRWLDLYLMIYPSQTDLMPMPGVLEAGLFLGGVGVFALAFFRAFRKALLSQVPFGPGEGLQQSESKACSLPLG